jgi:predicted negative regulator of RcsB-dependent stress response
VAAVEAATKFLSIEAKKTDSNMWFLRHRMLLQLGEYAAAEQWLGTAPSAGLAQPDQVCLKVQLLAAKGETVDARELWPKCDEGENVDLRRYTEGWLALAEGDQELAAKKLVLAGADDFGRLTIAYIRLDQQKPDMAHNLAVKVLEDSGWAADAQLANAEALLAMGKPTEALAEIDKGLMGDGWMEKHAAMAMDHVLLKTRGEGWPKEVAKRAALVKLKSVAAGGDYVAASLLKEQVAKVHGPSPELDAALDLPAGTSGVGRAQIAQQLAADAVLKRCFEKEKKKNPALAGQVVVDFAIGPDGTVSKAMSKSSTLSAPDLEKCTLDEVGKLKFTPAAGATETPVTYAVVYPM